MRYLIAATCIVFIIGCSNDDGHVSEKRQDSTEELTDALAQVPECAELPSPVDRSVLETGCFDGNQLVFGGSFDCDDGTVVMLAGDRWAGVEGGEWRQLDPATEFAGDLCP